MLASSTGSPKLGDRLVCFYEATNQLEKARNLRRAAELLPVPNDLQL